MSQLRATELDQWFPLGSQRRYVEQLRGCHGLTRRQAECFVRLWGYCLLKQYAERTGRLPGKVLELLDPLEGTVSCTQREAAELFYANQERGSDRAAGMMLDQLVAKKLVRKAFDGNYTEISIYPPANFMDDPETVISDIPLITDDFNPRTDTVPVATFLEQNYSWLNPKGDAGTHRIARGLRQWAQQYPKGMRVLRRQDNGQPVGFYSLFPTDGRSEKNFFMPPSESLYLFSNALEDPIQVATVGDPNCYAVFIRSWYIHATYQSLAATLQFVEDSRQTLQAMRQEFPNLCDLYAPSISPEAEAISKALGFQSTIHDPKLSLSWLYLALDHLLENQDIEASISHLFPH